MENGRILEMSQKFGKWLGDAIKDFAAENGLDYELWHQNEPVFYVRGGKCHRCYPGAVHFHKIVQVTAFDTKDGPVLCFIPHRNKAGIIKEDFGKLEQLLEQNKTRRFKNLVKKTLSKAWENETN